MSLFSLVVTEGLLEIPVAQKMLTDLGIKHEETRFVSKRGTSAFWRDAMKYNNAAQYAGPVLAVADLEQFQCPSGLITQYLPHGRHPLFILRIAERMLEAWLLADRDAIASFLRVSADRVPNDPDMLRNPKQDLVNLARQSRKRGVLEDIVPTRGSSGIVGRGYMSQMTEFIRISWRPRKASANSDSLRRALAAIRSAAA